MDPLEKYLLVMFSLIAIAFIYFCFRPLWCCLIF
jgi:cbb3-type cytochrome oxidase subunit 3